MNKDPQIGDHVEIVDTGKCYSTYQDMANKLQLKNYVSGYSDSENLVGLTGVIINSSQHEFSRDTVYAIKLDNDMEILMMYCQKYKQKVDYGFIVITKPQFLDNDLFEV